jgi:exodeoxyribonuclease V alpha subunit
VDIGKIDLFCRQGIDMDKIRKNPYKLLLKFDIPISVAEAIFYQNKNVSEYDIKRLTGFVYDTMKSTKENGSTCCEFWNLLYQINQRFSIFSSSNAEEAKMSASMLNLCIMEMQDIFSYQLIDDKLYIYFNEILKEEKEIVKNVKRLQSNTRQFSTDKTISQIEEKYGITYNTEQREAFDIVKTSGIKILTGPPGSGKTAVIKGLVDYFSNNGKVKLTATTGMASKVMADASQRQTQTVNQALNLSYFEESSYSKGLNDPIDADFIIVDEVSMLGTKLCSLLLPAVKNGSILLLVGDEDQLQSVEYGNVLHDLINCGKIDVYRLKEILRQSGTICDNAQKINQGNTDLKKDDSFAVYNYDNTTHAVRDLLNIKEDGNSVILTPSKLYKNNGTRFLNSKLQDDSKDILVSYGDIDFRCNDRVVMTKNNYERNYINGDLGQIVNYDNGIMTIKFADKIVDILQCDMADVDLAYALTIHKSQGSEFDNVYIILQDETKSMTTRRLLYTAITRAKKKVVIFNVNKAMETAIANRNENVRVSNLQKFLQKME